MPKSKEKAEDLHIFAQVDIRKVRLHNDGELSKLETNVRLDILMKNVDFSGAIDTQLILMFLNLHEIELWWKVSDAFIAIIK